MTDKNDKTAEEAEEKHYREHQETWNAAVKATDRILKETIQEAMDKLDEKKLRAWLRGFVS